MGSIKEINYQELRLNEVELSPIIQRVRQEALANMLSEGLVLDVRITVDDIKEFIQPIYSSDISTSFSDMEIMAGRAVPRRVKYSPEERFVAYCRLMNWQVRQSYADYSYDLRIYSSEAFSFNYRLI